LAVTGDETEATQIFFLLDLGYSFEDALDCYEEVSLFNGTAKDYAYDLIEETTEIPENFRYYIDYDAIATTWRSTARSPKSTTT